MLVLLLVAACLLALLMAGWIAWEAAHPPRRGAGYALARGLPLDPGDLGLPFEEWILERPDGARLPVWDIALNAPADAAESAGLTLVLLHGWGRSRIDSLGRLRAVIDAVPGAFRRALLLELRGHGESVGRTRLGDREEEDVLELLGRLGEGSVVLAGHSMGGVVSIFAAAANNAAAGNAAADHAAERIAAVVAWAPYEDVHGPIRRRLEARSAPARPFSDLALLMLRLAGIRRRATSAAAARLRCPLLAFAGEADPISPAAEVEAIAAAAPQGHFELTRGAAHADVHAADAEAHARALRSLVTALAAASPASASAAATPAKVVRSEPST